MLISRWQSCKNPNWRLADLSVQELCGYPSPSQTPKEMIGVAPPPVSLFRMLPPTRALLRLSFSPRAFLDAITIILPPIASVLHPRAVGSINHLTAANNQPSYSPGPLAGAGAQCTVPPHRGRHPRRSSVRSHCRGRGRKGKNGSGSV